MPAYYAVSWFVQQAVEKGLKALYIERFGALAPRIHDLEELGDLLHVPAAVDVDLSLINPTFDEVRYPDMSSGLAPVDAFTETRTTQHLTAADRIMSWLNEQFNPPSTQP